MLGPLLSLFIILFFDLSPSQPEVTRTAAVAVLLAFWWITEALPLAVTALLPVVLFPLVGIMESKTVSSYYFNDIIFLFIGGFILALAMQRWDLHKRIALRIILLIGITPKRLMLGFMGASTFLSMWISNTTTAMIMVPIAMALLLTLEEGFGEKEVRPFAIVLLLGIAYATSIGGAATLVGSPPNLVLAKIFSISFPKAPEISFVRWFIFAFPISFIFFLFTWLVLILLLGQKSKFISKLDIFKKEYSALGKMEFEEWVVLVTFAITAFLWLFRKEIVIGHFHLPGWSTLFPNPKYINDGTVAMTTALPLFFIPARGIKKFIMDWETASRLPWGLFFFLAGVLP